MENFTANSISSRNLAVPFHPSNVKALGTAASQNSQANGSNPELRQWIEQAQQYMTWYSGVVSGKIQLQPGETLPSDQEMAQFQQEYQWATGGSASQWDPSMGSSMDPSMGASQDQGTQLPPGAKMGAQGNIVFPYETADVNYQPSNLPVDVLSDTLNLNVPVKAKVDVESAMDTRLNPPTGVIKITIHDRTANPADTVYFVNAEAKININTIGGKDVTQHGTESLNLADGTPQVTVGTYQAKSADSTATGLAVETKNSAGALESEAPDMDTVLIFAPKGSGKAGVDQLHLPVGNCNIQLTLSDKINATKDATGVTTIVITHKDGSTDTFKIQKGFTVNLQGINPAQVSYHEVGFIGPVPADETMPEDLAQTLTINGGAAAPGTNSNPTVDTSEDTQPDKVNGNDFNGYNGSDVSLHAVKGADKNINVKGDVKISLSPGQYAHLSKTSTGYDLTVTDGNPGTTLVTYHINGQAKSINIDAPESAVKIDSGITSGKIQIQGVSLDKTDTGIKLISDQLNSTTDSGNITLHWGDTGSMIDGGSYQFCLDFINSSFKGIASGLTSGDWSKLKSAMDAMKAKAYSSADGYEAARVQNGYSALFMALYSELGPTKFKMVLSKLSSDNPDLFQKFKNGFNSADSTYLLNPVNAADGNKKWATGDWATDSDLEGWTMSQAKDFVSSAASSNE